MRSIRSLIAGAALLALAGCYSAPVMPPPGYLFADYSAPIDLDAEQTPMNQSMGEATSTSILGLIATGDCSINTAATNGGLRSIDHVDYHYTNLLGIIQNFTTRVYGSP